MLEITDTEGKGVIGVTATMETDVNLRQESTICGFCGVGCGLSITVEDGVITKVAGDKENPSSKGEACIKGREGWRHVYSDRRLTRPLVRKDGALVTASWDDALDLVANRFMEIKSEYGEDAFGVFSSSRSTNELNYLAGRFVREVLGNSNIDSCNRA